MNQNKIITRLAAVTLCCLATSAIAAESIPAGALATVNGKAVDRYIREAVVRQLESNGQPVDESQILTELINLELLSQKAAEAQLDKKNEVAALLRLQYNQTLAQAYMSELARDINISDSDLQNEYKRQTAGMTVDEYRASHILLEDEQSASSVINELEAGSDFVEVAKNRSTGPTGPQGGDLGWFQLASMVPEFSDALRTMSVGEISETPVESGFGWHVIQLVDKRGTNKPEFDDIKSDLNDIVMRGRLTKIIDQMRAEADIEISK